MFLSYFAAYRNAFAINTLEKQISLIFFFFFSLEDQKLPEIVSGEK